MFISIQAVSDLEKGWTYGSKEDHSKLAQFKQKGAKLEVSWCFVCILGACNQAVFFLAS